MIPLSRNFRNKQKIPESIISEEFKKASVALLKKVFHLKRYIIKCVLEYACYFKNEFSELTKASSPQTSPGHIVLESMIE